jgi:glycosyltransferase involved in cell wall biosynthesis
MKAELGIRTGPVIGSVGRLAKVKGYDRLIRAFAGLAQSSEFRVQSSEFGGPRTADGEQVGVLSSAFTPPSPQASDRRGRAAMGTSEIGVESSDDRNFELRTENSELGINHQTLNNGPYSHTPILLLIGDGPERADLERLASQLGVADRVLFAGFRKDARDLYGLMDLFILPSRSEGLSVALLEAMSSGVPVLVTDAGDNRRIVGDGACGTVLPEDDDAWPDMIAGLLPVEKVVPDTAQQKARSARERVASRYSMDSTLSAYEKLYAG